MQSLYCLVLDLFGESCLQGRQGVVLFDQGLLRVRGGALPS